MYRLLKTTNRSMGIVFPYKFVHSRNRYRESLEEVKAYYQKSGGTVNNRNIIVKLIYLLDLPEGNETYVHRTLEERIGTICRALGISNPESPGRVQYNEIHTDKNIFIATNFSTLPTYSEGLSLRPIRFLSHPTVGYTLKAVETNRNIIYKGLSIIGIDIPMLAVLYKRWRTQQSILEPSLRQTVQQFIYGHILPNMIDEQVDISLRNRLVNIRHRRELGGAKHLAPINIPTFDDVWESEIYKVIKEIDTKGLRIEEVMDRMPLIFGDSYKSLMVEDLNSLNTNTYWVSVLIAINNLLPILISLNHLNLKENDMSRVVRSMRRYIKGVRVGDRMDAKLKVQWKDIYSRLLAFA